MPELPEVQTTVNGLNQTIIGLEIVDVWSGYDSPYFKGSGTIKDRDYFKVFRKSVIGSRIKSATRRAKNILIHLSQDSIPLTTLPHSKKSKKMDIEKTILVHMKMTGHLLFGTYNFNKSVKKDPWEPIEPESLKDPFNRRVRFVISFSNGKFLALSDTRKFAKVTLIESGSQDENNSSLNNHSHFDSLHLKHIGPEPLEKSFTFEKFVTRLKLKPKGKIKLILMDQTIIAGIGNIYADESLWHAGIHPTQIVSSISNLKLKLLFTAIKKTLARGIDFGGDSMSDYRNVHGHKGEFQETHHAYRKTGSKCDKKGCGGKIVRIVVGGRATHYCDRHQK